MRHLATGTLIPAAFAMTALSGCGIFGDGRPGLVRVDDLVDRIERVHVDSELAKQAAHESVRQLRSLTTPGFGGDIVAGHAELKKAIEASKQQAAQFRSAFDAMEDAADPVFDQWADDAAAIANARVRERSTERLDRTRARYDAIVRAVGPTVDDYEALNRSLQDIALFLGHDFNPAALRDIATEVEDVTAAVGSLDASLEDCLVAARGYLEASAIQVDQPAEPAGPPLPQR